MQYYLTDAMSLKEIAFGVREATITYKRINGDSEIRKFLAENVGNIICKIKRAGYLYGLNKATGLKFKSTEDDYLVEVPYGAAVINVGVSNSNQANVNDYSMWDIGMFDLELRILYIERPTDKSLKE